MAIALAADPRRLRRSSRRTQAGAAEPWLAACVWFNSRTRCSRSAATCRVMARNSNACALGRCQRTSSSGCTRPKPQRRRGRSWIGEADSRSSVSDTSSEYTPVASSDTRTFAACLPSHWISCLWPADVLPNSRSAAGPPGGSVNTATASVAALTSMPQKAIAARSKHSTFRLLIATFPR
jgi:hypothetical protein